jgi:hypothetical protein
MESWRKPGLHSETLSQKKKRREGGRERGRKEGRKNLSGNFMSYIFYYRLILI